MGGARGGKDQAKEPGGIWALMEPGPASVMDHQSVGQ